MKLLIEKGGFYDRGKDLNWKNLRNVQFVAAMGPPGGGRNRVDPRFISLFNVINIPFPSTVTLTRIYSTILDAHLEPFHDGIKEVGATMTDATLKLYKQVSVTLPPTPSKFHYIFNLRDLSRIFEGLCRANLDKFDRAETFVRLWRNESMRVFCDRLIVEEDTKFVTDSIKKIMIEHWPDHAQVALSNPILFGDYRVEEEQLRILDDYGSYESVKPFFEEQLLNYNDRNTPMNLVLFDDALEHLSRILRIIRRPRGHALLVGVAGSGKQSLARLATFVAKYNIFEITISRGYGETELREDLKRLYTMLGM